MTPTTGQFDTSSCSSSCGPTHSPGFPRVPIGNSPPSRAYCVIRTKYMIEPQTSRPTSETTPPREVYLVVGRLVLKFSQETRRRHHDMPGKSTGPRLPQVKMQLTRAASCGILPLQVTHPSVTWARFVLAIFFWVSSASGVAFHASRPSTVHPMGPTLAAFSLTRYPGPGPSPLGWALQRAQATPPPSVVLSSSSPSLVRLHLDGLPSQGLLLSICLQVV
jgi:hypothetical protein